jgi:hypothetical protein
MPLWAKKSNPIPMTQLITRIFDSAQAKIGQDFPKAPEIRRKSGGIDGIIADVVNNWISPWKLALVASFQSVRTSGAGSS